MKFNRDILLLAALAQEVKSQNWYPANFATPGGEEICVNDGAHPTWLEGQGLLMGTVDGCCLRYFSYMNQLACIASSNGVTYTGSGKFYPKYLESKCAQDCDVSSGGVCGGVVTDTSMPFFSSIGECCAGVMGHMDADLCAELSSPSGGTNKYYADTQRSLCLKDCEPGASAGCTRVTNPSAKLYPDLSTCCSEGLPWASTEFCNTRSVEQTSNKWFASKDHLCRQDCTSGATCANLTDSTETLYDSALDCCKAELTYISEEKCDTLSLGNPLTGSSKWFASYEHGNERCVQDCPTGGNCAGLADPDVQLFDNATLCCQTKLPYKSLDYCKTVSVGGIYGGSLNYYPDYQSGQCVKDCDPANAGCGGIVTDSSKRLFASASACCNETLPSIDSALCQDRSNSLGTGTGKFYVEPGSPVCIQDTGLNRVSNPVTPLYDDAQRCCEALPWVSTAFCTSRSSGGYSDKWYVADYSTQKCSKDCATGTNCVPATNPSTVLFDTALDCCNGKLSWLDSTECDANSNGTPIALTHSNKFYVSYADNKCMQDCTGPTPCGGKPSADKDLFDDAETCCSEKLHWLNENLCVANTNGVAPAGSNGWYVDWTLLKCVQDCVGTAPCGGLKTPFHETYDDSAACCTRLSWINATECVLA